MMVGIITPECAKGHATAPGIGRQRQWRAVGAHHCQFHALVKRHP